MHYRHLSRCQRPRLVGTHYRCRAERFNDWQAADERVTPSHAAHADGQGDCCHGRQSFRHGSNGRCDAHFENQREARLGRPI